jgi:hypothetical protein
MRSVFTKYFRTKLEWYKYRSHVKNFAYCSCCCYRFYEIWKLRGVTQLKNVHTRFRESWSSSTKTEKRERKTSHMLWCPHKPVLYFSGRNVAWKYVFSFPFPIAILSRNIYRYLLGNLLLPFDCVYDNKVFRSDGRVLVYVLEILLSGNAIMWNDTVGVQRAGLFCLLQ